MKKTGFLSNSLMVLFIFFSLAAKAQVNRGQISFSNFSLEQQQNKIMIKWDLYSKTETNYFEIEKSIDGKDFKTVAYVLGADPLRKNRDCFSCFDKITIKSKEAYYRLKQVAQNGSIQYSEVKMLALK